MVEEVSFASAARDIAARAPQRPRVDQSRLTSFLQSQSDYDGPIEMSDLQYIEDAGGSNGIALFDIQFADKSESFVLRYAPGEQLLKQKNFADEFKTLKALQAGGIAAPIARWCDPTGEVIGFPFLVMEKLEGRAPANRMMFSTGLLAEVSPAKRKSMLLAAAGFHGALRRAAIGADTVPHLVDRGIGCTPIERELSWWLQEALLITAPDDHRRAYLVGLHRWMVENQPDARPATLAHGDGQIANLMFSDGVLVAGLDWELSYLGHNEADLALVVLLIPMHVPPNQTVEGLPSEAEVIARYEAEAGAPVEHWAYFKLFNLLKISTIMLMSSPNMGDPMADALWDLNANDRRLAWASAKVEIEQREFRAGDSKNLTGIRG